MKAKYDGPWPTSGARLWRQAAMCAIQLRCQGKSVMTKHVPQQLRKKETGLWAFGAFRYTDKPDVVPSASPLQLS